MAPRQSPELVRLSEQGIEHVKMVLRKFDVDHIRGFLPSQDPLQRLSYARYHLWEDLGDDIPKLLGARLGQARCPLRQLPVLSTDKLLTDADLRRAHLLLCLFAHAYVWGGNQPLDHIPEGIAKPLWEVSEKLGIPPVLAHCSIVLYNWRRLDTEADVCMENLSTLNNFFDGRDESWFYLITVEVEAKGAAAVIPMMLSFDAIQRYQEELTMMELEQKNSNSTEHVEDIPNTEFAIKNQSKLPTDRFMLYHYYLDSEEESPVPTKLTNETAEINLKEDDGYMNLSLEVNDLPLNDDRYYSTLVTDNDDFSFNEAMTGELSFHRVSAYISAQLNKVQSAIKGMVESLRNMREGCHPFIFYHRVRPFLSAWKQNPTLPEGILYKGVSEVRQQFYGGSAAQSSLLPFLDISLGVAHESIKSKDFLLAMRDYMLKPHREFLKYIETIACIRSFVTTSLKEHDITDQDTLESIQEQIKISKLKQTRRVKLEMRKLLNKKVAIELRTSYDNCVMQLKEFRSGHMALVADYILAQQHKDRLQKGGIESSAGGKGTGGTDLMSFLRPIRDNCNNKVLGPHQSLGKSDQEPIENAPVQPHPIETNHSVNIITEDFKIRSSVPTTIEFYIKDNGCSEDIDLYRGAAKPINPSRMSFSMEPVIPLFTTSITTP